MVHGIVHACEGHLYQPRSVTLADHLQGRTLRDSDRSTISYIMHYAIIHYAIMHNAIVFLLLLLLPL